MSPKLRVERLPKSFFMSSIKSQTKPEPKVVPKPEPKVVPKPEPKVVPKSEPKVVPKSEPKMDNYPKEKNENSSVKTVSTHSDLAHYTDLLSHGSSSLERSAQLEEKKKKNAIWRPPITMEKSNGIVLQVKEISEQSKREDSSERETAGAVSSPHMERAPPVPNATQFHCGGSGSSTVKEPFEETEVLFVDDQKGVQEVSKDADTQSDDASPIESFQFEASQSGKLTIGRNTTFDLDNLLNDVDFETELMEMAPSLDTIHEEASQSAEKEETADDVVDASEMWECEVLYDYQADADQLISVYAGQHVWGVVESGDWTQIRTEDGRVCLYFVG